MITASDVQVDYTDNWRFDDRLGRFLGAYRARAYVPGLGRRTSIVEVDPEAPAVLLEHAKKLLVESFVELLREEMREAS